MSSKQAIGRHEYSWWFRLLLLLVLLGPFYHSAMYFFVGNDEVSSFIALAIGVVLAAFLAPLLFKSLTFSILVEPGAVHVEYFGAKETIRLDEITDVRVKEWGTFESISVLDKWGKRFSLETGLRNFKVVKRFLLDACIEHNFERYRARSTGEHRYHKSYRVSLAVLLCLIWFIGLKMFPTSVFAGQVTSEDLDSLGFSVLFLVAAVAGSIVAARQLTFVMVIDSDGIRSKWLGTTREIRFEDVSKVRRRGHWPFESLLIADDTGNKILCEPFLENYEDIKRYLLNRDGSV